MRAAGPGGSQSGRSCGHYIIPRQGILLAYTVGSLFHLQIVVSKTGALIGWELELALAITFLGLAELVPMRLFRPEQEILGFESGAPRFVLIIKRERLLE